jgi:aspartyl/glutamyl-tRNA(Asn/Gln) amidotransferase C subunit
MATVEEVKKLAALARISVPEAELEQFTNEFDAILAYVGQLEKLELPKDLKEEKPTLRNAYREDADPIAAGEMTKKMVEAFPEYKDDYLVVKQIITHE